MSTPKLTKEQSRLLTKIKTAGDDGLPLPKYYPLADQLAAHDLIVCRRSDNNSETWWIR